MKCISYIRKEMYRKWNQNNKQTTPTHCYENLNISHRTAPFFAAGLKVNIWLASINEALKQTALDLFG